MSVFLPRLKWSLDIFKGLKRGCRFNRRWPVGEMVVNASVEKRRSLALFALFVPRVKEIPQGRRNSFFKQKHTHTHTHKVGKVLGKKRRYRVSNAGLDCHLLTSSIFICANYRPLTLLSIPSKKTEPVICQSFHSHLRCVLQRNKWRYRKVLSSESLLLYITEMWKLSIDNGKVIGAIFIDFRKAFDSEDYNILGYKLQACGITGSLWEWFLSYLTNRH